ncbi:hypothetical protein B14911_10312 [Bacillus sp. NRRL B-14911]|nr:hypothetical protein B14911_10312 [Bacillus sp. NRRL B-14911]
MGTAPGRNNTQEKGFKYEGKLGEIMSDGYLRIPR